MKKHIIIWALLLGAIILTSCKKDNSEPTLAPTCETGTTAYAGIWLQTATQKTISIEWVKNRCPMKNANHYVIRGMKEAVDTLIKSGYKIPAGDLELISDEGEYYAREKNNVFRMGWDGKNGITIFHSGIVHQGQVGKHFFVKIK